MSLSSKITDFLKYLEAEKNASNKTIENYGHYLKRFLEFTGDIDPLRIDMELIREYRFYLSSFQDPETKNPLKRVTQNYFMIALRAFLRYLDGCGIQTLPAEDVALGKGESQSVSILDKDSLNSLLSAPTGTKEGLRDKAVLETLFSTGLRVSELAALNRFDISLPSRNFTVNGKGCKQRVVFLSDGAIDSLGKYLQSRKDSFKPLFIRFQGRLDPLNEGESMRLTTRSIERIVEKYVKLAGLSIKATPATLRHTFATDLLTEGEDIESVQQLLGHSHVSTTQIYKHLAKR